MVCYNFACGAAAAWGKMAKAVFTTKAGSGYDDDLAVQYHFPSGGRFGHYLLAGMAAEGDWILYQEPRRNGGRMAYVAVARVVRVVPSGFAPACRRLGD